MTRDGETAQVPAHLLRRLLQKLHGDPQPTAFATMECKLNGSVAADGPETCANWYTYSEAAGQSQPASLDTGSGVVIPAAPLPACPATPLSALVESTVTGQWGIAKGDPCGCGNGRG
jgi:hypothetical protein